MTIGFWLTTPRRFKPEDIDITHFGGAEMSGFHLAYQLSYHHKITIFGNVEWPVEVLGIDFKPYDRLKYESFDVLIIVRADQNLLNPRRMDVRKYAKKVILWTGDAFDQPNNQIFHDKFCLNQLDLIATKSNWQRETLLRHFPLLDEHKVMVMYNGVPDDIPESTYPTEPKFVYASTAYRGLHRFLDIWPRIKERIPNATLDCYTKKKLYMGSDDSDNEFRALYAKLERLDGIVIKEPLPQRQLHQEFTKYFAMLYPNCGFLESSCGVALEAMAVGMPVIASAQAGLAETLQMCAGRCLVKGDPESIEYVEIFVGFVVDLYGRTNVHNKDRKCILGTYSWSKVAERWQTLLSSVLMTGNHLAPKTEMVSLDSQEFSWEYSLARAS